MNKMIRILSLSAFVLVLAACERSPEATSQSAPAQGAEAVVSAGPTVEDAADFVAASEERLARLGQHSERMGWVLANFITGDTEVLAARAAEKFTAAQVEVASEADRFNSVEGLDYDTARKLDFLKSGIIIPAPMDAAKTAEQSEIGAKLSGLYGRGSYCRENGECLALGELEDIMAQSRNADELLEAWEGWRTVSPPMKDLYARQVELANEGAAELGFNDLGTMWRSAYDMDPAAFPGELDKLWEQVSPLYEALHCHVLARLGDVYGSDAVPANSPIPAHLLGNMWAQSWENIYDLVAPPQTAAAYDLTAILQE